MIPVDALKIVIRPTLLRMGEPYGGPRAEVMLLKIGLQESGFATRVQGNNGPARGFWQFEKGGGVHGVLTHPATRDLARATASRLIASTDEVAVWKGLAANDELACVFGRLLLYSDPNPLPDPDDVAGSWHCYQSIWRPGKPKPDAWAGNCEIALGAWS